MENFIQLWGKAAFTTVGYFWMAFWAFVLGYVVSSVIQVFVTKERMRRTMGEAGPKSVALGTFFGFISSSCSFAALATTKSLFKKGAGLVPSLAFLLASTNLVIELGIVIAVFLSWQFVVGEYLGGLALILVTWLVVKLTLPDKLEERTREQVNDDGDGEEVPDWKQLATSVEGWRKVARRYFMEWGMVWKDVTFGFTVAGIIAAFVPDSFFKTIFMAPDSPEQSVGFLTTLTQTLVGPAAAFFTFIGSMGNIPLAAVLYGAGVSFAGVMAFIFSDLVVFPVLRVNAKYYGWKMSLYIAGVFLVAIVGAALLMHYGFTAFDMLPESVSAKSQQPGDRFAIDYTFWMNLIGLTLSLGFACLVKRKDEDGSDHSHGETDPSLGERTLSVLAITSLVWLAGGLLITAFV